MLTTTAEALRDFLKQESAGGIVLMVAALLALIFAMALLTGALPAWRAYRHSLADGLTVRL